MRGNRTDQSDPTDRSDPSDQPNRRSLILGAAFEEFAAKGFRGATIKSIARAARLQSSALIYWYFPTKEALFRAVLGEQAPILRAIAAPETLIDLPPEEVLPTLAHAFLATAGSPVAERLLRLVIGEALRHQDLAATLVAAGPRRMLTFLTAYLDRQIALGRLRPHNTQSSARAFIGMLIPQAAGLGLLPALAEGGPSNADHVATVTALFLHGLGNEAGSESGKDA
ncbi:MAG TPA: TetR/AcrR family transcriptional regulator [Chloroflexota bacterium]|nr:TetR/AcrR family transcriptional regulator [Chloroflexota bacterium]